MKKTRKTAITAPSLAMALATITALGLTPAMSQDSSTPPVVQNGQGGNLGLQSGQGNGQPQRLRRRRRNLRREGDPLGARWAPGQDNSQNAQKLKTEMKRQERRELRQYNQAMTQVKEQQQQQYETEMLQTLGKQRPAIKRNRQDIKETRQETGADQ